MGFFDMGALDCMELIDKTWDVYQKIKNAPEEFKDLKNETETLHEALEQTKLFLADGDIAADERRRSSLQHAFIGCKDTIDELEKFVHENSSLAKNDPYWFFRRLKFVSQDIEELKRKLNSHTTLLTLSITSMSGVSQLKLQKTLETMLEEYRDGRRKTNLLTGALVDNRRVNEDDILHQVTKDLEDLDVHPESIRVNQKHVRSWLAQVLANGGLGEGDVSVPGARQLGPSHLPPLDLQPESSHRQKLGSRIDSGFGIAPEDGAALASIADETTSDNESISSHRSKPAEWRPYDRPDETYVQGMLAPLFQCDPFDVPPPATCEHRIRRAYYQEDWKDQGYLTRPDVSNVASTALQDAGINHQVLFDELQDIIASYDSNKDHKFDINEFSALMHQLIERSATVRRAQAVENLTKLGEEAALESEARMLQETKPILPWGFSRKLSDTGLPYRDYISNVDIASLPAKRLTPATFSVMALDAEYCVRKLAEFERTWIGIVPKGRQDKFLVVLKRVRDAAFGFLVFENPDGPSHLSKLDNLLISYDLASRVFPDCVSALEPLVTRLQSTQKEARQMMDRIKGFVLGLEKLASENLETNTQSFPEFRKRWDQSQLPFYSQHITRFHLTAVQEIVQEANAAASSFTEDHCQRTDQPKSGALNQSETGQLLGSGCENDDLHSHATKAVEVMQERAALRRKELESTTWSGKLSKIEIEKWRKSIFSAVEVYVVVEIEDPAQKITTKPTGRGPSMNWSDLKEPIHILPHSRVSVEVWYCEENKRDILKYKTNYSLSEDGVIGHANLPSFNYRKGWTYDVKKDDPTVDHELWLYFDMEDQSSLAAEIRKLQTNDWTSLLPPELVSTVRLRSSTAGDPPAATYALTKSPTANSFEIDMAGLPPGWESGQDRNGRVFYVNYQTKETTWTKPENTTT